MNCVPNYHRLLRGCQPEFAYELTVRPRPLPRRPYLVDDAIDSTEQLALCYKELYERERQKNQQLQDKDWRLDVKSIEDMFVMFVRDGNSSKLLMVRASDYVRDVKLQYKIWWQTGERELILQYRDTILEDNKTLEQCGITTYCRVNLVSDYQETEVPNGQPAPNDRVTQLEAQVNTLSATNQELEARNKILEEHIDKFSVICVYCKSTQ
jgi:Ubiquitin family